MIVPEVAKDASMVTGKKIKYKLLLIGQLFLTYCGVLIQPVHIILLLANCGILNTSGNYNTAVGYAPVKEPNT